MTREDHVEIKRTEEVEDYMVHEMFAILTLGNMLTQDLPDQFCEVFGNKPLTKEDFAKVVAEVVLQYDAQFGISRFGEDPVMARKIKEELERKEKEGLIEIAPEKEVL